MKTAHRRASSGKRRYTADPMAMFRVLGKLTPFTEAEQATLNLPVRIAFEALRTRTAVESDFHTLAAAVNISMVCAEKIDPVVERSCVAARDAMQRVFERHAATGHWGLDGPAFAEIEQAVEIYEQINALLPAGQVKDALEECYRRISAGDVIQVQPEGTPA
ncbi:hypothetical protein D9M73_68930 [compost metagenome]